MSNKYVKGYEPDLTQGKFHPNAFFDPAVKFANAGDPKAAAEAQNSHVKDPEPAIEVIAGNAVVVSEVSTPETNATPVATDGETVGAPAETVSPEQTEPKQDGGVSFA